MTAAIQLDILPEPLLAFGHDQSLEHPKDGLFLYGPLLDAGKPAEIKFGVIGTANGLERFRRWSAKLRHYIPPFKLDVPHHAAFPGFEAAFDTAWPEWPMAEIEVQESSVAHTLRLSDRHDAIKQTVELFAKPIQAYLRREDAQPTIWFVVIPEEVHRYGRPKSSPPKDERIPSQLKLPAKTAKRILKEGSLFEEEMEIAELYRYEVNFHHQLKARLLADRAVIQIVRETTLTPEDFITNGRPLRTVQDPATVSWNIATTAFFKAGGKPWKLASVRPGVCYVGLVFKQDGTNPSAGNACCGAQMFLNSGDGLVFRGAVGPWYSEMSREYHLNQNAAAGLMKLIVDSYTESNGRPPDELFIHGRARFGAEEWAGFRAAVPSGTNLVGVRIRSSNDIKLYRPDKHPVMRGTTYRVNERMGYLWANGFIPRLKTYPGWEVPNPLSIQIDWGEADLLRVMEDVLGLTKVNFNACVFGDGCPVTLKFANAVGEILTAAPVPNLPPLPFRHYI
ncbi:hypothetical protein [Oleispirillum naphthae]|uniref:hypothetical protein n=1 Tax=Oleispirillum naphthae TaxID=2838853 RepID=UPI0030825B1C